MSAMRKPEVHMPTEAMPAYKVPGHWLLARLGKRVLRPGGLHLTRKMIEALAIRPTDRVVEFAPGLGVTARMTLGKNPAAYTAIEQDQDAATQVRQYLKDDNQHCIVASAHKTGLPDQCADVVYGEAMLSMQPKSRKLEIVGEAARLLPKGGRYAIHELCIKDVTPEQKEDLYAELAQALHVGATPLTQEEWVHLLEASGFKISQIYTAPMALLEPRRILDDEGFFRGLRFFFRLLRNAEARARVQQMRSVFKRHRDHLAAIVLIAEKQ